MNNPKPFIGNFYSCCSLDNTKYSKTNNTERAFGSNASEQAPINVKLEHRLNKTLLEKQHLLSSSIHQSEAYVKKGNQTFTERPKNFHLSYPCSNTNHHLSPQIYTENLLSTQVCGKDQLPLQFYTNNLNGLPLVGQKLLTPMNLMFSNNLNAANTQFQYSIPMASQQPVFNADLPPPNNFGFVSNDIMLIGKKYTNLNKKNSVLSLEKYAKVKKSKETIPLSNCTGRKKALLIGINYFKQKGELKGCINDVKNIKEFIKLNYGFREENMRILTDDQINNLLKMPTRQNIIDSMNWLVDGAQPNDSFFFHYSGHGGLKLDEDGDEEDGFDQTILPVDYLKSGEIVDDEMNAIMVRRLPVGSRLTAVFDSCHSGTALDLPYVYTHEGRLKAFNIGKVVTRTLLELGKQYIKGDVAQALEIYKNGLETLQKGDISERITKMTRGAMADVIMFSGCMDSQSSADTNELGFGRIGAMSHALITALNSNPKGITYLELLNALRSILKGKYTQLPQLSSGREMDMNSLFNM